jgi:long-chain acyl-CoA synthetase
MEKRYSALIESMYYESAEVKVEAPVTYRDGRRGVVTTSIKVREVPEE